MTSRSTPLASRHTRQALCSFSWASPLSVPCALGPSLREISGSASPVRLRRDGAGRGVSHAAGGRAGGFREGVLALRRMALNAKITKCLFPVFFYLMFSDHGFPV